LGDLSKNFSRKEFECKCGCGEAFVDINLIQALQFVRDQYGKGIKITSGYRCAKHNAAEGGKPDSAHLTGKAVDISANNSRDRYTLIRLLTNKFSRIGIAKTFIHVDVDDTKPQNVCWLY
jgi:uncharacterized protein YcbK (DUF882 family)